MDVVSEDLFIGAVGRLGLVIDHGYFSDTTILAVLCYDHSSVDKTTVAGLRTSKTDEGNVYVLLGSYLI